jgi:hypothetical protein
MTFFRTRGIADSFNPHLKLIITHKFFLTYCFSVPAGRRERGLHRERGKQNLSPPRSQTQFGNGLTLETAFPVRKKTFLAPNVPLGAFIASPRGAGVDEIIRLENECQKPFKGSRAMRASSLIIKSPAASGGSVQPLKGFGSGIRGKARFSNGGLTAHSGLPSQRSKSPANTVAGCKPSTAF